MPPAHLHDKSDRRNKQRISVFTRCLCGVIAEPDERGARQTRRRSSREVLGFDGELDCLRGTSCKVPVIEETKYRSAFTSAPKKVRPALGGGPAAREPGLGTGRGGDVTGLAELLCWCALSAQMRSAATHAVRRVRPKHSDRTAIDVSQNGNRYRTRAECRRADCRE
jgi:hypothetical protein